jgi:NAD(P)H-hydrate epimerase
VKAPIPEEFDGLPVVTSEEMRELDRRAVERCGIPALALMEKAGEGVARHALELLKGLSVAEHLVTVCCGRGNNGGDGLVVARLLKAAGLEVMAFIAPPKRDGGYSPEVKANLARALEAGVSVHEVSDELVELDIRLRSSALLVDALLGTGSSGKPAGPVHRMIQCMMKAGRPILAVDVPSGIDPNTGYHSGAVVAATRTCALGLPKRGLLAAPAARYVGELRVVDIGFPRELVEGFRRK